MRDHIFRALSLAAVLLAAVPAAADSTAALPAEAESAAESAPLVWRVRWDDAITPVTKSFLEEATDNATAAGAAALLVELDTPGGLLDATRDIVSDFYRSPVPVIVWVGPSGARAASAGVFITMAAHVAAMAPGTNIGAASPVNMGGGGMDSTMASKMFEDTAAFARAIAERRGRNAEWAEQAVIDAKSVTEAEALQLQVVDHVENSVEELLAAVDGTVVELPEGDRSLRTAGARVETQELGLRWMLLSLLANPNVSYILLMFGMYGLFFELSNPGSIFPGVVGAIFLILAFYSLQTLPLNMAGLLLILVGLVLFLMEVYVTSFGLLTVGGLVATVLGAMMLFDSPDPAIRVSLKVIVPLTVVTAVFFAFAVGLSIKTLRTAPTTGARAMIGQHGVVRTVKPEESLVEVRGELWRAVSDTPLDKDDRVEIVEIDGLVLRVRKG